MFQIKATLAMHIVQGQPIRSERMVTATLKSQVGVIRWLLENGDFIRLNITDDTTNTDVTNIYKPYFRLVKSVYGNKPKISEYK